MKKQYQIEKQRAAQQFRRLAAEENPNIQMVLPLAEIVSLLQQGVGNLLRQAGLELMRLVMDEEVKSLAGERHQQHRARRAHRWGKEDGYCVVDGQKVPIRRTRLRSPDQREQRLGSYELFQRSGLMQAGVWDKMMRELSTRNYGAVVRDLPIMVSAAIKGRNVIRVVVELLGNSVLLGNTEDVIDSRLRRDGGRGVQANDRLASLRPDTYGLARITTSAPIFDVTVWPS